MNRWFTVAGLLLVAAIGILVLIILVAVPQRYDNSPDPAVRIALADPDVRTAIANDGGSYTVDDVAPQGLNGKSGFISITDALIAVELSMPNPVVGRDRYVAFVSLNQSKVVSSEWYSSRGIPATFDIALPPGASYYHVLYGGIMAGPGDDFGLETFFYHLDKLSPGNAMIYPTLVDKTNLWRMINGSTYEAAVYNDTYTRMPAILNGSSPVGVGWMANASIRYPPAYGTGAWPDFNVSPSYYLVMRNGGPDTAGMSIDI